MQGSHHSILKATLKPAFKVDSSVRGLREHYNILQHLCIPPFFFAKEQNFNGQKKKKKTVWFPLTTPSSGHISPVLSEGSRGVKAALFSCLEFLMITPTALNCVFKGREGRKVYLEYNKIQAFKYQNVIIKIT